MPPTTQDFTIVHFYIGKLDRNYVSMYAAQNPRIC